jgi:hypothetical protein
LRHVPSALLAHEVSPPNGKIRFKVPLCDTLRMDEKSICGENFAAKAVKTVKELLARTPRINIS